jgi:hypothetical protein
VWTPNLVLQNPAHAITAIGTDISPVRLLANGVLLWYPNDVIQTLCPADVTYYPFDVQSCSIYISSYGYSYDELVIHLANSTPIMDMLVFNENVEWDMSPALSEEQINFNVSAASFNLHISRRST